MPRSPRSHALLLVIVAALSGPWPARSAPVEPGQGLVLVPTTRALVQRALLGDASARSEIRERTNSLLATHASGEEGVLLDRIVVCVDEAGAPILPDQEAARFSPLRPQVDLTFTYDSPTYPWSSSELTALSTYVSDFYPAIKALYGDPAFGITVNVRKDPTISPYSGTYNPTLNEIALTAATANIMCHEMIHAFRDDALMYTATFEEGMTMAAEVEVFNRLASYTSGNEDHRDRYEVFYEAHNQPAIGSWLGLFAAASANLVMKYYLSGYAWWKALQEDPNFFVALNQAYYMRHALDPALDQNEDRLLNLLIPLRPGVEGHNFQVWYSIQNVFDQTPPGPFDSHQIYQRVGQLLGPGAGSYSIAYFLREYVGEFPFPGDTVNWEVRDYNNQVLSSGSGVTNSSGVVLATTTISPSYVGRIRCFAQGSNATGSASDITYRSLGGNETGFFGATLDPLITSVTITSLSPPGTPVTASVSQGAFFAPIFAGVAGRFEVRSNYSDERVVRRIVAKDKGGYYLQVGAETVVSGVEVREETVSLGAGSVTIAPNPFRTEAVMRYRLPASGRTVVKVYSVDGRLVRTLVDGDRVEGLQRLVWDGRSDLGTQTPSGVYWLVVSRGSGEMVAKKRLVRLR